MSHQDHEPGAPEPNLGTILAAVDFSPSANDVLAYASRLAQQHHARLRALHVIEWLESWWNPMKESREFLEKLRREGAEKLKETLSQCGPQSSQEGSLQPFEVDLEIAFGKASRAILDVVDKREPDLVVLGRETGLDPRRNLLGSTTERVVGQAKCPVLTVPGDGAEALLPPRRILLPTDLSLDFEAPMQAALRLAGSGSSAFEIFLLHAVDLPHRYSARVGSWEEFLRGVVETTREHIEEGAEELRVLGFETKPLVEAGDPAELILRTAERESIDLIALCNRGSVPKRPFYFGSTARQVVRDAPCPVLTVSPEEFD